MNGKDIFNIDCMEFMKGVEDNTFNLTVTDIPYGEINFIKKGKPRISNGLRKLNKGNADIETFNVIDFTNELCRVTSGSIYIFCGTKHIYDIRKTMIENGMSTRVIIWRKTNPSPMNGDKIWLSGVEFCVYGKFPKATFNLHCKNCVLDFPSGRSKVHPTEKPLKLIEQLILASSNPGDIVFDPCVGSGTTLIASFNLNRRFVGCELNKEYFDIAVSRLNSVMPSINNEEVAV